MKIESHTWILELFGYVLGREWAVELGRETRCACQEREARETFRISPEHDTCVHLMSQSGQRAGLLLAQGTAAMLVQEARERAVVLCQGKVIQVENIALEGRPSEGKPEEEWVSLEEHERRYLLQVPEHTGWVVRGADGAAALLGKHESTLRNRMRKLGIQRP